GQYLGETSALASYFGNPGSLPGGTRVTVPAGASPGIHYVYAVGAQSGVQLSAPVRIAVATPSTLYGTAGTRVRVQGSGLLPGEGVDIYFDGDNTSGISLTHSLASNDIQGSVDLTYTVPLTSGGSALADGIHAVMLYGETSGARITMSFTA